MSSLSQIKIELDGIGHTLSDREVVVPKYQRSYAWEEKHIRELFGDLADAIAENESEYFLGSIVLTHTSAARMEVVDGQQRLATITVFLAAVRDYFFESDDINRAEDIEHKYLMKRDLWSQESTPRLQLNELDHDFFHKRILLRSDHKDRSIAPTRESHRRLDLAASMAARRVADAVKSTNDPISVLRNWVEYVATKAKIILVQVPDDANAFTIFETLNDRGLDLAVSDLLKNYLFGISQDRIAEVQQRWTAMFGALEAVDSEEMAVQYIRHLWSSKNGLTREKDLYDGIKKRINAKQHAVDFSTELSEGAKQYAAILNPHHEFWDKYGTATKKNMVTLNLLGMVQMRPLLLAIMCSFQEKEIQKSFRLMVSWAVRFLISGGLGGGTLEARYCQQSVEIRNKAIKSTADLIKAMQGVVPNDSVFKSAFEIATVSKSYLARYYLHTLENQAKGGAGQPLIPNNDETVVNLEHVLPQNPSSDWGHIDPESARAYYNRIGNLALLTTGINSDIGNAGFSAKRPLLALAPFTLTTSIAIKDNWGELEIQERQASLAKLALKAWPIKV